MSVIPTEDQEQAALIEWAELSQGRYPELRRDEKWEIIPNTNGIYKVSSQGRVMRLEYTSTRVDGVKYTRPQRIISQTKDKKGYLNVGLLMANGKRKTTKVHRLVLKAFSKTRIGKPQVNHIDSDKTNNRLDNLEWVDQHENMTHSVIAGTKWTKPVRCKNDWKVFKSMRSASRYYEIGHKEISQCCHGILKKAKGLSFEFASKEEAEDGIYRKPRTSHAV